MANALASMIQREQDTDREKRNALAPDINWVTPNVGQVIPKWVSTSEVPWLERAYRDAKDVGDVVVRGALDIPNKLMMAVTDREAPAWALRNLTPAGQMVQGANQFAAGLRGTEVAENIWDQPEPLADAPWLQRAGNMATGIANMALAYTPMEKAVGGAVGSIGTKVADKWPMQKAIYVGPKSKAWATRPQVGMEGETVPEGAFSSLYDRKPRVEIDDSGAIFKPEIEGNNITPMGAITDYRYAFGRDANVEDILLHPELYDQYDNLGKTGLQTYSSNTAGASYSPTTNTISMNKQLGLFTPDDDVKKTMIHELQHAVQEKEGFARGGSPGGMQLEYNNLRGRLNFLENDPDFIAGQQKNDELWDRVFGGDLSSISDLKTIEAMEDEIKRQHPSFMEASNIMKILGQHKDDYGQDAYQRLAGEIEARDAAARANMTMAERRATPPYSSENIPVDEAIVRFDRNGPQDLSDAPWLTNK